MEVYVLSGNNTLIGDNENTVEKVVSDTEIVLVRPIKKDPAGDAPSNIDYYIRTGAHADNIQLYNPGGVYPGSSEYVYTENVIIRGNTLYNSSGQIILWNGFIPEVEGGPGSRNILVEDNLMYGGDAHEFHVGETENLTFRNNTVIGNAIFRRGITNLHVENNIVTQMGFAFSEGVTVAYENFNVVNALGSGMPGFVQGDKTIALNDTQEFENLFVDYDANDFRLKQGLAVGEPPNISDPCFMSSTGSFVGSEPCIGCENKNPVPVFTVSKTYGYEPLEVQFDASHSLSCDSSISSYNWAFGDGVTAQGQTVAHTYSSGNYSPILTVINNLGNSGSNQKNITVLPSAVPNLVLYQNFDGSALDFSGKNNHGEWQGSESYGLGVVGQAASFDGTDSGGYVLVDHDETLDGMNKLTLSAWAKKNDAAVGGYVFLKHITYSLIADEKRINTYVEGSGGHTSIVPTTDLINDTEWHHYALTYDGNTAKVYVDGQELESKPFSESIATNPARNLYIGKNPWGNNFNGLIDEVKIYDKALTGQEILASYENNKPECVNLTALTNYIVTWKQGSLPMLSLIQKISSWKSGQNCP